MEDDASQGYATFLHSLDDEELLNHVHSFSAVESNDADNFNHNLRPSSNFNLLPSSSYNFDSLLRSSSCSSERITGLPRTQNALQYSAFPVSSLKRAKTNLPGTCSIGDSSSANDITLNAGVTEIGLLDPLSSEDPHVDDQIDLLKVPPPLAVGTDHLDDSDSEFDGDLHEFGDYKTYFINKQRKQHDADAAYVKWDSERRGKTIPAPPKIFKGCSIHVNGYTVPSINEIHRLVILHGGVFLSYLSNKGAASHIICDRLTPKKMLEFRNYRVVKAKWIVDSIESGVLQDWKQYRLITEVEYGQGRLQFDAKAPHLQSPDEKILSQLSIPQKSFLEGFGLYSLQDITKNNADSKPVTLIESDSDISDQEFHMVPLTQPEYNDDVTEDFEIRNNIPVKTDDHDDLPFEIVKTGTIQHVDGVVRGNETHNVSGRVMDANHPDFLSHFFANSRLHHLLTWKADLRLKFLRKLVRESKTKQTQLGRLEILKRVVLHVDFDCFFAAASCLRHPQYNIITDPIAIAHGTNLSDVASCNYVARKEGVHNGMWVGSAKKLCPNLILLGYEFDTYEKVSKEFYNYLESQEIFDSILPVLIDEVLIDATLHFEDVHQLLEQAVSELCTTLRRDIMRITGCSVSVGASENILLAKLALRQAKPNGIRTLFSDIPSFLLKVPVSDLPGVGKHIRDKVVHVTGVDRPLVADLLPLEKVRLISAFGDKTGTKLYEYARGIDETQVALNTSDPEAVFGRKSVSVDVNYGIRFETVPQLDIFFSRLAKELYTRLVLLGICGSSLTLKLARRAQGAPEISKKHMGLGIVDFVSKSSRLGVPTNDYGVISSEIKALYRMLNIPVRDLRGIAITMSKLLDVDKIDSGKQMKLPFGGIKSRPISPLKGPTSPIILPTQTRLELESLSKPRIGKPDSNLSIPKGVDPEVFLSLPYEIRRELEKEFRTRGLIPQYKSPTKCNLVGKMFMQQLIPSQLGASPKYVRVVEQPAKSPSRRSNLVSPLKSVKKQLAAYHDSDSLDSLVLKELPTFIRNEVLKEEEQKRLSKSLAHKPLKDQFMLRNESRVCVTVVSKEWIKQQPKFHEMPPFLNRKSCLSDIKKELDGWIEASLHQGGPHMDDVEHVVEYLVTLALEGYLARSLFLIKFLNTSLAYYAAVAGPDPEHAFKEGLLDWRRVINLLIRPRMLDYCKSQLLSVHISEN